MKNEIEDICSTPDNYISVRLQIVHVKKRFIGFKDNRLGGISVICNNTRDAIRLYKRLESICKKYGVEIKL